jgi:hypothetical protein
MTTTSASVTTNSYGTSRGAAMTSACALETPHARIPATTIAAMPNRIFMIDPRYSATGVS